MDIKKLEKITSMFFIIGIYLILMSIFSENFNWLIFKSYFIATLFWGFLFIQILGSLLIFCLLLLFFKKEIFQTFKKIEVEQIILFLCVSMLFLPFNSVYKIIILYSVYPLLEILKFFIKRKNSISTVIILLNIIISIFYYLQYIHFNLRYYFNRNENFNIFG